MDFALLAGESQYQTRSALDHLIRQLVIASGNEVLLEDNRRHHFPIFATQAEDANRNSKTLEGISSDLIGRFEQYQPFVQTPLSPIEDPLWRLQELNNVDKHRLVPTVLAVPLSFRDIVPA